MKKQHILGTTRLALRRITFFLGISLFISHFVLAAEPRAMREGEMAPSFKLMNVQGKEIALSDFHNKPVILFFWATWCPYCTAELPYLQKQYNDIKARGVEVLAIDINEPQERLEKFLDKHKVTLTVLIDKNNQVATSYKVMGIPTYVLIDSAGKIRFHGNTLPSDYLQLLD